ncbi:efflux RND transporter periplasmic adaptor subunit [Thiocapsa rosea]|uniref:Membrane fusion protein (Multidrug efflux system) n=1 Tax=Thiocapsa rosea TaxID=69360 RepID=A0A495V2P3_9GAMM|nr:efflux RND transporter periplasmic adaptor subunit [Thiocapsa rosea]RKT42835.1 membrane fusion protein (multidrug efflux system) [Thiocapsa rosea]
MGSARLQIGIALALPIGIALLLAGCNQTPGSAVAAAAPPPPEVGTFTIVARPTTLTTELPGRTVPYRIAEVRPRVSGLIQDRLFTEGGEISAGQVLYQIDPAVYQAAYDSAEAALARSQATLDRARLKADRYARLANSKAVSQEDNDDTQAALKEAAASVAVDQAALERARIDLAYSRVESPIAGRIGRSTVTQGALVTANQSEELATVQQIDPIYVDLTQSSTQLLKLRRALADGRLQSPNGEQAKVTLILEDGRIHPHAGRLESSEVTVDQGTGTVTLRATIPNPEQELLPGMFVRARVEEGIRPDAILVPQQGVQHDRRGNPIALVVNDEGTVEERKIETTRTIGDQWLIDAGLEPGDRVIVEGSQKARPGTQVRVMDMSDQPGFAAVR